MNLAGVMLSPFDIFKRFQYIFPASAKLAINQHAKNAVKAVMAMGRDKLNAQVFCQGASDARGVVKHLVIYGVNPDAIDHLVRAVEDVMWDTLNHCAVMPSHASNTDAV